MNSLQTVLSTKTPKYW